MWTTLALVIAGGFVVSPTAAASNEECTGEGGFEQYVLIEDPVVFETYGENGVKVGAHVPSDRRDLYHYVWTSLECAEILDDWLDCIKESTPANAVETCVT